MERKDLVPTPPEGSQCVVPSAGKPTDADLSGAKNSALLPILQSFAAEIEERIASGKLAKELGEMRASQIIFHITKIAQALKAPSMIQVGVQVNPPDQTKIRTFSALKMTEGTRTKLHNKMDRLRG